MLKLARSTRVQTSATSIPFINNAINWDDRSTFTYVSLWHKFHAMITTRNVLAKVSNYTLEGCVNVYSLNLW